MKKLAAFVAAAMMISSATAATQGGLGETSTGDFKIYYSKGNNIQIWGFEDVYFTSDQEKTSQKIPFCVASTSALVRFKVDSKFYMGNNPSEGDYTITITGKDEGKTETWGGGELNSAQWGKVQFAAGGAGQSTITEPCSTQSAYQVADLTVDLDASTLREGSYHETVTVTAFPI